jgi:CheY-like chemotaxis protein
MAVSHPRDPENSRPVVLVAEDEAGLRRSLADVLGRHGYGVLEAMSGEEVVVVARKERPALILMDVMMPLLDGYAAARVLRRDPATRGIPILAFNAPSQRNGGRRRGAPLRPDDEQRLIRKIHVILEMKENRPALRA